MPEDTSKKKVLYNNNSQQITSSSTPTVMEFPNGKDTLRFEEFIDIIQDSC